MTRAHGVEDFAFHVGGAVGDHRPVQGEQHAVERQRPPDGGDHLVAQPEEGVVRRGAARPGGQAHQADDLGTLRPGAQRLDEAAELVGVGHALDEVGAAADAESSKSRRVVGSGLKVLVSCQSWPTAMRMSPPIV